MIYSFFLRIYLFFFFFFFFFVQLSQHNKELASLLKPTGKDIYGDQALDFYAKHTAQIEVSKNDFDLFVVFLFVFLFFGGGLSMKKQNIVENPP